MVCQLTYGKRQWESLDSEMRCLIPKLHYTAQELIPVIDADTEAFMDVMVSKAKTNNFTFRTSLFIINLC